MRAAGVYFVSIRADNKRRVKKVCVVECRRDLRTRINELRFGKEKIGRLDRPGKQKPEARSQRKAGWTCLWVT